MSFVVKTLDSKMLQDTQSGIIITAGRPHLVPELTGFLEARLSPVYGTNYKLPVEVIIVLKEDEVPEGISDAEFGVAWGQLKRQGNLTAEFYEQDALAALDLALKSKKDSTQHTKAVRQGGNVTISTETGAGESKKAVIKRPQVD